MDDTVERHGVVVIDVGAERGSGGRGLDVVAVAVVRALVVAHRGRGVNQVRAMAVRKVVLLEKKIKHILGTENMPVFLRTFFVKGVCKS